MLFGFLERQNLNDALLAGKRLGIKSERIKQMIKNKELITGSMLIKDDGIEIDFDGYVSYFKDNRYGEDADGFRGSCRIDVEGVEDFQAYLDASPIKLDESDQERAEEILIHKFLLG